MDRISRLFALRARSRGWARGHARIAALTTSTLGRVRLTAASHALLAHTQQVPLQTRVTAAKHVLRATRATAPVRSPSVLMVTSQAQRANLARLAVMIHTIRRRVRHVVQFVVRAHTRAAAQRQHATRALSAPQDFRVPEGEFSVKLSFGGRHKEVIFREANSQRIEGTECVFPVKEIIRRHGISERILNRWRFKFGGMEVL